MSSNPLFDKLAVKIFCGNPYDGFDASPFPLDLQGQGSEHPNFAKLIDEIKPKLIIEVGTWKGASAVHMAKLFQAREMDTPILCVDTWLGAMEFRECKNDRQWLFCRPVVNYAEAA